MGRIHKASVAFARFSVDEEGATAIEYAVICAFITLAIVGTVTAIGQDVLTYYFERVAEAFPH